MQQSYIKSLDGVRALAILPVMAFHFGIIRFGWMGVQLFFVLSGFLISNILLKEKVQPSSLLQKLKKFWIRRSLRIFPVYYFYLFLFLATFILFAFPPYYLHDLPYLATYTFNLTRASSSWHESSVYTHFWSLCVEEQFYFFFPFIIFLFSAKALKKMAVVILLAIPVFRWLFSLYLFHIGKSSFEVFDIVYWFPVSHLDAFFTGTAIHLLQLKIRITKPWWLLGITAALAIIAGWISFKLASHGHSYPVSLGYNFGDTDHWQQVWYYTLLNCMFGALLLLLISQYTNRFSNLLRTLLESRLMVSIGRVSYGMYIFHWVIQTQLVDRFIPINNNNKYWLFLLDVPLVYLCAWISFVLIEKRFILLKNKLSMTHTPVKTVY